jgi:uncharacterized protein (TIGR00725 family)
VVVLSAGNVAIPDAVNYRNCVSGNLWIEVMEIQGLSAFINNYSTNLIILDDNLGFMGNSYVIKNMNKKINSNGIIKIVLNPGGVMSKKFIVGVMGPGDTDAETEQLAKKLGRLIAVQGWVVLSGGRNFGVMQAVNEGAKDVEGSLTVGILPSTSSQASPFVDIPIITDMHSARNNINILSSDIVVACGEGGPGTASEIALALKASKNVILLGASDEAAVYFKKLGGDRVYKVNSADEVIETIRSLLRS